jgi:hypothetical protein
VGCHVGRFKGVLPLGGAGRSGPGALEEPHVEGPQGGGLGGPHRSMRTEAPAAAMRPRCPHARTTQSVSAASLRRPCQSPPPAAAARVSHV